MFDENKPVPITEDVAVSPVAVSAQPDPFNPSSLRLPQNFSAASVGVKRVLNTVPVRKPGSQDYVRVHSDPAYSMETLVLELKEDRETFLVARNLWPELPGELIPKSLYTAVNRQGVLLLWPVRLPGEDGRLDTWNSSAHDAAKLAKDHWVRVQANMSLGAYDIFEALGNIPDPEWPDATFEEILKVAFRGHYIESLDHPAIRRLRGEA